MKKVVLIVLSFCFFYSSSYGQINLKTYSQKTEKGYDFLADNDEYCPVSVKVDFTLNNMKSSEGNNKVFVIPARSKGVLISKLTYIKRARYGYNSKIKYNYGDHFKTDFDESQTYDLPFPKDEYFYVHQGYNGDFSHQNKNSLDFTMPINTNIYAVKKGVVVKVVDENSKNCPTKECLKYNNVLMLYHVDGTFSEYAHINTNGARVKVGDTVKKGQLIAKSGNVGFSTGPHLHFTLFYQQIKTRKTLKTKFKIDDGTKAVYLKEKEKYKRTYD